MGKSRKSLTRESRRVHSGQWSQKTTRSSAGRRPLRAAAWGRTRIEGGGWDAPEDAGRLADTDEGRWSSRRRANRSAEERA